MRGAASIIYFKEDDMMSLYRKGLLTDPKVIAHRGAVNHAPENTLAAFRYAFKKGYRHFTCDVRCSVDREIFLHHDVDLKRTTNGCGRADEVRWELLSKLDAGSHISSLYAGESIPHLEAIVNFVISNSCRLNIEVKNGAIEDEALGGMIAERLYHQIMEHLDVNIDLLLKEGFEQLFEGLFNEMLDGSIDYYLKHQFLITSSSPQILKGAFAAQAWIPRGYIVDPDDDRFSDRGGNREVDREALFSLLKNLKCSALIIPKEFVTPQLVERCRQENYLLFVTGVDEIIEIDQLLKMGVDSVITDNIDAAACFS